MNYLIGVEREGLRIRLDGKLADTPHPAEFGDRLENPLVGTDFGEAMLELRTRPKESAAACYEELLAVTRRALAVLYGRGELVWPYSLPCEIPDIPRFRYNSYPGRPELEAYERRLTDVYGLWRNSICGIHVNLSVSDDALAAMRRLYPSVPADKDEAYLGCARQILRHEAALRHFFDASPTGRENRLADDDSYRNSPKGMRSENAKRLDYSGKAAYLQSLKRTSPDERRAAVRLKSPGRENTDEGIARHGVGRLEFRLCDIDPFDICGISLHEIELVAAVFFSCMANRDLPDGPMSILDVCEDTDRTLRLGLGDALRFYREQEAMGIKKSGRVRALFAEQGAEGLGKLALLYGKACSEGIHHHG